jgi:NADH dehydrogenase
MKHKSVCIIGGTGFVGRHIAYRLSKTDKKVRVLTRNAEKNKDLRILPGVELIETDVFDTRQLEATIRDTHAVINLVGILNEKQHNGEGFHRAHVELPKKILGACLSQGVPRLLHMSALHADVNTGTSLYLRTKGEGENALHTFSTERLVVTSFRPSVIFGPGDSFLNRFAGLLKTLPLAFPLACPNSRFAPVFVGDVADRFVQALDDKSTYGQRYDLCGPEEYTLKELVEYTAHLLELNRRVIGLPDWMSKAQANVLEWFPGKPFSIDNYKSLQIDSICKHNQHEPTSLEMVAPTYLGRKNRYYVNDDYRKTARRS